MEINIFIQINRLRFFACITCIRRIGRFPDWHEPETDRPNKKLCFTLKG